MTRSKAPRRRPRSSLLTLASASILFLGVGLVALVVHHSFAMLAWPHVLSAVRAYEALPLGFQLQRSAPARWFHFGLQGLWLSAAGMFAAFPLTTLLLVLRGQGYASLLVVALVSLMASAALLTADRYSIGRWRRRAEARENAVLR